MAGKDSPPVEPKANEDQPPAEPNVEKKPEPAAAEQVVQEDSPSQTEGKDEDRPAKDDSEDVKKAGQEQLGILRQNQTFYGPIFAAGAQFGGSAAGGVQKRFTGSLDDKYIHDIRRNYVPPKGYGAALKALGDSHIVVLEGPRGKGKHAGAIQLLREVTGQPLFVLSPTSSLKDLHDREYQHGCGYLFEVDYRWYEPEYDFGWHIIRDRVRKSGAWLIATGTPSVITVPAIIIKIPWERPCLTSFIRAWLPSDTNEAIATISIVKAAVPDHLAMVDLVRIVRRIAEGGDPDTVIDEELNVSTQSEVQNWFDERRDRTRDQMLEVAATIFLDRSGQPHFERHLNTFRDRISDVIPEYRYRRRLSALRNSDPGAEADRMLGYPRHGRGADTGLIRLTLTNDVPDQHKSFAASISDDTSGGIVEFRSSKFRSQVIAELWARMDILFWDAVRIWICEVAEEFEKLPEQLRRSISTGIAELAEVAVGEVVRSYLEPWSRGQSGPGGRLAAVYSLAAMSVRDGLASTALTLASHWASSTNSTQQLTAILAFCHDFGVVYPTESVERLLRMSTDGEQFLRDVRCSALAELFERLTNNDLGAEIVLCALEPALVRSQNNRRSRSEVLLAVSEVLSVRELNTDKPVIFRFLRRNPEHLVLAARLWAAAICHRPRRRNVLDSLLDGLTDLPVATEEAEKTIWMLVGTLHAALPPREHGPFLHDLAVRVDRRNRAGDKKSARDQLRARRRLEILRIVLNTFSEIENSEERRV